MCCLCSGHLEIVIVSGCEDVTIASRNFIHGLSLGRKASYFYHPTIISAIILRSASITECVVGYFTILRQISGKGKVATHRQVLGSSDSLRLFLIFINIEINNVVLKVVNFATNVTRYWTYEVIRIWKG